MHPYDAEIVATAVPAQPDRGRFRTFEGIRAMAALAIVVFHAGTYTGLTWNVRADDHGVGGWVRHLDVGVTVFFVLSAFLLYRPFVLAHLRAGDRPELRSYLLRRITRLFPAYWLALSVGIFVFGYSAELDMWGKFRLYALIQVYWSETALAGLPQAWSLNTEVAFYLFLPLWAALMWQIGTTRRTAIRGEYLGCVALYVASLGFRGLLRANGHEIGYTWLPSHLDAFALGMALAVASAAAQARARDREVRRAGPSLWLTSLAARPYLAVAGAVVAYGGVVMLDLPLGFDRPTVGQEVGRQILFGLVAVLIVIPGAFGAARGWWFRIFSSSVLHSLGVVSYGIYLWHITTLYEIDARWWPEGPSLDASVSLTLWLALLGAAAASAVAVVSWRTVEQPLLERARRWGPR